MKRTGWHNESARHGLAAKGVKSGRRSRMLRGLYQSGDSSFSAETILEQLGGNKFIAMTGAKNFVKDEKNKSITFKIGRNAKNVNYVEITLNPKDLYDVEFIQFRAGKRTVKSKANDVYFDQLQEIFTEHTGMATHL